MRTQVTEPSKNESIAQLNAAGQAAFEVNQIAAPTNMSMFAVDSQT